MKPPWAAPVWVDADFVYMELPSPVAGVETPLVVKFVNDSVGLAQALRVLDARRRDFPAATVSTKGAPTQLQVNADRRRKLPPKRPKAALNPDIKASAQALLKRMGMI